MIDIAIVTIVAALIVAPIMIRRLSRALSGWKWQEEHPPEAYRNWLRGGF